MRGDQICRKQIHLIVSEQSNGFQDLDQKLQNLIIGISEGSNTYDELKDLLKAESISTRQHTSQEFHKVRASFRYITL